MNSLSISGVSQTTESRSSSVDCLWAISPSIRTTRRSPWGVASVSSPVPTRTCPVGVFTTPETAPADGPELGSVLIGYFREPGAP